MTYFFKGEDNYENENISNFMVSTVTANGLSAQCYDIWHLIGVYFSQIFISNIV